MGKRSFQKKQELVIVAKEDRVDDTMTINKIKIDSSLGEKTKLKKTEVFK